MHLNKKRGYYILIVAFFLILPWFVFLAGYNPFTTAVAPGDGKVYGMQMQIFTESFRMWNPYLAGGKSQLAEVGSQSLYLPAKIIMNLFPTYFGYNLLLLLHYSMAGYFTYRFIKTLDMKECPAILGGIAFMFCGFMSAHKGHNTMVCVAAYLPCILYLIEKYMISDKRKDLVIVSLVWGLSITADYTASSLYIAMVCFPYLVYRSVIKYSGEKVEKKLKEIFKSSMVIFGLGTLTASYYLFPIIESLKYVTRESITYDFFTGFSFPIKQLGMILLPSLFGGGVSDIYYFGEWNITEIAGYMGLLVLIVAVSSVLFSCKKNLLIRFWAAVAGIGFILVLGGNTPLYRLMYKIPVYNMFRAPARNWLEVNFSICILFAYGVNLIMNEEKMFHKLYSVIKRTYIVVFTLEMLILILIRGLVSLSHVVQINNEKYAQLIQYLDQNVSVSSKGIYIYLIILFLTGINIYYIKIYRKKSFFWILTGMLVLADLFPFAYFHDNIRTESYRSYPVEEKEESNVVAEWVEEESKNNFRVWNLSNIGKLSATIGQNKGIMAINSYGPIWLKEYTALTNFNAAGGMQNVNWLVKNNQILSMTNTKYIVTNADNRGIFENTNQSGLDVSGMNRINEWEQINAVSDHERVILNAVNGGYSLIQFRIAQASDLCLRYVMSLDMTQNTDSDQGIYVDFLAPDGSYIAQKYYSPNEITDGTIKDSIMMNGSYSDVYLRIFSYSKSNIIINNCRFEEMYIPEGTYIKRLEDESGHAVYENTNAFERAYFVDRVIQQKNTEEQIAMIQNAEVDLRNSALTENRLRNTEFQAGKILDSVYDENKITLNVDTAGESFLVLADNYYKGWNVFIDGVRSEMYKVNAIQRGVVVPEKGRHIIEFVFRPVSFYLGIVLFLISIIIMIFFVFWNGFVSYLGRKHIATKE